MLRFLVTTAFLLVSAPTLIAGEMNPAAAASDIELAREALQTLHPGYDRYTPAGELDALWDALEARAAGGIDRGTLYLELSRILAAIRCDHTKAELPKDMAEARSNTPVYLPFRFKLFANRMYVDVSGDAALERGDEVIAIDGIEVSTWLARVDPLIPVDGDTDATKPLIIEYGTEFMGGALDHFAPFLEPLAATASLRVRSANAEARTVEVDRIDYEAWQALTGEKRYSRNFDAALRFATIGDDGAYLAVDTFVNYRRPVDAVEFLQPYFRRLKDEGRDKLIVDLRRNGGGSNDAQTALLRYLIRKPVLQTEGLLTRFSAIPGSIRPHLDTWERAALDPDPAWFEATDDGYYRFVAGPPPAPVDPLPDAFTGNLVILTSGVNASGVTHMLANLRTHGDIRFVGEKTGGAPTGATANILYYLTLPESGILVRVPAQRTLIANRNALPARDGLAPDVAVTVTADDWFADRDRVLEVATRTLGLE